MAEAGESKLQGGARTHRRVSSPGTGDGNSSDPQFEVRNLLASTTCLCCIGSKVNPIKDESTKLKTSCQLAFAHLAKTKQKDEK